MLLSSFGIGEIIPRTKRTVISSLVRLHRYPWTFRSRTLCVRRAMPKLQASDKRDFEKICGSLGHGLIHKFSIVLTNTLNLEQRSSPVRYEEERKRKLLDRIDANSPLFVASTSTNTKGGQRSRFPLPRPCGRIFRRNKRVSPDLATRGRGGGGGGISRRDDRVSGSPCFVSRCRPSTGFARKDVVGARSRAEEK